MGNPFSDAPKSIAEVKVASREEAIACYEEWLRQHPEMIERAKRVGAELDARADLAEARGALQHDGGHPDLGEGQCCRETADPSSRDQNGVRNSHGDASPSDLRTGMPFA